MKPSTPSASPPSILRIVAGVLLSALLFVGFFWLAGGAGWVAGWVFVGVLTLGQTVNAIYVKRRNPGLLSRRGRVGEGTKGWDKIWLAVFAVAYLAIMFLAAFEAGLRGQPPVPLWSLGLGLALYALGMTITTWAMGTNPHFEKTVRIQGDCDHKVIDDGPYASVRHPGYLGTIFAFPVASTLLLGSLWAAVPAVFMALWIVVRTALEDRTLHQELPGYREYALRVRFRLVPGIW